MAENRISIEGVTPASGQLPVTGTVVSTPSGTQNVAVTGQPINMQMSGNTITNPLFTSMGSPSGVQFYTYSLIEAPGVVASNNFLSIFNPVASGKVVSVDRILIFPWSTAAATATRSMTVTRVTAASAGTLVAAASVPKFATTQTNAVCEIRTGNPTVTTTGLTTLGFPPAITTAGAGVSAAGTIIPPQGSVFQLQAGEGLVFNVAAGDVDQLWNINIAWDER